MTKTVQHWPNGFELEYDDSNWQDMYRLKCGNKVTNWGTYEDILQLDDFIVISPYYTGEEEWVTGSASEVLKYFAIQEKTEDRNIDDILFTEHDA